MATFAFTDPTIYVGATDLTTYLTEWAFNVSADELDNTTFGGGGYRSRIGGLRSIEANGSGNFEGTPDSDAFTNLGLADQVFTTNPDNVEGSTAYGFQAGRFVYAPFGAIGEVTPFNVTAMGTNGVGAVRGMLAKKKGNVSATGALGSVVNLGAPSATQYVYATFHVFSAGTTITVLVESDTAANFPSATTRATIGPITTTGGTWMTRVAGPFAGETHWRFNVSAITGTFSVAGMLAVQ